MDAIKRLNVKINRLKLGFLVLEEIRLTCGVKSGIRPIEHVKSLLHNLRNKVRKINKIFLKAQSPYL